MPLLKSLQRVAFRNFAGGMKLNYYLHNFLALQSLSIANGKFDFNPDDLLP